MKTKFVVVTEIEVTHPKRTFVDQNSVLGLIGTMIGWGRNAHNFLEAYDGKNEFVVNRHTIKLSSVTEFPRGEPINIDEIEEYT